MSDVISFSRDEAFSELQNFGEVYTFRTERRAEPNGECWVNRGRGETKEWDAKIVEIEVDVPPTFDVLEPFVRVSGFEYVEDWQKAIAELNGGEMPESGYIYRVDRRDQ